MLARLNLCSAICTIYHRHIAGSAASASALRILLERRRVAKLPMLERDHRKNIRGEELAGGNHFLSLFGRNHVTKAAIEHRRLAAFARWGRACGMEGVSKARPGESVAACT